MPKRSKKHDSENEPPKKRRKTGASSPDGSDSSTSAQQPLPHFLQHLWSMLHDASISHIISWHHSQEDAFVVHSQDDFSLEILPKYFKHNKFTSFVRQLNMYQFHKMRDEKPMAWRHDFLLKGNYDLLFQIQRRTQAEKGIVGATRMNRRIESLEDEVKALRDDFSTLRKDLLVQISQFMQQGDRSRMNGNLGTSVRRANNNAPNYSFTVSPTGNGGSAVPPASLNFNGISKLKMEFPPPAATTTLPLLSLPSRNHTSTTQQRTAAPQPHHSSAQHNNHSSTASTTSHLPHTYRMNGGNPPPPPMSTLSSTTSTAQHNLFYAAPHNPPMSKRMPPSNATHNGPPSVVTSVVNGTDNSPRSTNESTSVYDAARVLANFSAQRSSASNAVTQQSLATNSANTHSTNSNSNSNTTNANIAINSGATTTASSAAAAIAAAAPNAATISMNDILATSRRHQTPQIITQGVTSAAAMYGAPANFPAPQIRVVTKNAAAIISPNGEDSSNAGYRSGGNSGGNGNGNQHNAQYSQPQFLIASTDPNETGALLSSSRGPVILSNLGTHHTSNMYDSEPKILFASPSGYLTSSAIDSTSAIVFSASPRQANLLYTLPHVTPELFVPTHRTYQPNNRRSDRSNGDNTNGNNSNNGNDANNSNNGDNSNSINANRDNNNVVNAATTIVPNSDSNNSNNRTFGNTLTMLNRC